MTDTLSPSQRSEMMSRIRGRDTKPELQVRSILHRMGYRFTLDNRDMPGSPDIVLPRYDVAIFVHGCFWHRHEGCRYATTPKTRRSFWNAKFQANIARDRRGTAALRRDGWRVWTVWECQLRAPEKVASRLQRMLERVSAGY